MNCTRGLSVLRIRGTVPPEEEVEQSSEVTLWEYVWRGLELVARVCTGRPDYVPAKRLPAAVHMSCFSTRWSTNVVCTYVGFRQIAPKLEYRSTETGLVIGSIDFRTSTIYRIRVHVNSNDQDTCEIPFDIEKGGLNKTWSYMPE